MTVEKILDNGNLVEGLDSFEEVMESTGHVEKSKTPVPTVNDFLNDIADSKIKKPEQYANMSLEEIEYSKLQEVERKAAIAENELVNRVENIPDSSTQKQIPSSTIPEGRELVVADNTAKIDEIFEQEVTFAKDDSFRGGFANNVASGKNSSSEFTGINMKRVTEKTSSDSGSVARIFDRETMELKRQITTSGTFSLDAGEAGKFDNMIAREVYTAGKDGGEGVFKKQIYQQIKDDAGEVTGYKTLKDLGIDAKGADINDIHKQIGKGERAINKKLNKVTSLTDETSGLLGKLKGKGGYLLGAAAVVVGGSVLLNHLSNRKEDNRMMRLQQLRAASNPGY